MLCNSIVLTGLCLHCCYLQLPCAIAEHRMELRRTSGQVRAFRWALHTSTSKPQAQASSRQAALWLTALSITLGAMPCPAAACASSISACSSRSSAMWISPRRRLKATEKELDPCFCQNHACTGQASSAMLHIRWIMCLSFLLCNAYTGRQGSIL